MKYYSVSPNGSGFGIAEIEPLLQISVTCKGNTSSTAIATSGEAPFARVVVLASYVDASNNSFVYSIIGITGLTETDIFAAGPDGSAITMFLPSGVIFNDGSTSINIPCGTGKKFMIIGTNSSTFSPIVGVMN